MAYLLVLVVLALFSSLQLNSATITVPEIENKTALYFSYITTLTGVFVVGGGIPLVDLALEQINNRTDILANYSLSYTTVLDSKVSQTIDTTI